MLKRVWMLLLLAAALSAGAGGAGYAVPSMGGPTGIVAMPTAAIAPTTDLQVALSYRALQTLAQGAEMYGGGAEAAVHVEALAQAADMYAAAGDTDATVWSLQVLRGVSDQAELWAAYQRVHNTADSIIWELGGKILVDQTWLKDVKVAVGGSMGRWVDSFGMSSIAAGVTDMDSLKAYAVATKDLTPGATPSWEWGPTPGIQAVGSAGIYYQRLSPDEGEEATLLRPFVGVEVNLANNLAVGLEYRAKDSELDEKAVFSAMLRRTFGEDFWLELGTSNASPVGLGMGDQDVFVRLCYDIPMTTAY